ncbi:hypothetical protein [Mucilaginibacter sp.]
MNQAKEYNNQKAEAALESFINLVNRYCAHPNHSLSSLIKSTYQDFFFIIPPYFYLPKHEKEQVDVIRSKLNGAYGKYLDKRDGYLSGYRKKKYSY